MELQEHSRSTDKSFALLLLGGWPRLRQTWAVPSRWCMCRGLHTWSWSRACVKDVTCLRHLQAPSFFSSPRSTAPSFTLIHYQGLFLRRLSTTVFLFLLSIGKGELKQQKDYKWEENKLSFSLLNSSLLLDSWCKLFFILELRHLRAAGLDSALNSPAASGQVPSHHSWVREGVWCCGTVTRG